MIVTRNTYLWLCLLTLLFFNPLAPVSAATLTVPAQYATIQAAINASQSGDTVLIADGTYTGPGNVDLDFGGRNITVTSQNWSTTTIFDCGGSVNALHRGFYLHSGETSALISGLTIQNGDENVSGGGDKRDARVKTCAIMKTVALGHQISRFRMPLNRARTNAILP